jgi:hypothetical protein
MPKSAVFAIGARDFPNVFDARFRENRLLGHAPSHQVPERLQKIAPLVKSVCMKHDVPYVSTPFIEVQKSLRDHIVKMGVPDLPVDSCKGN